MKKQEKNFVSPSFKRSKLIEFDMRVKVDQISCKMAAGLIFFYYMIFVSHGLTVWCGKFYKKFDIKTRLRGVNLYAYKRILISHHVFNYKVYTDT